MARIRAERDVREAEEAVARQEAMERAAVLAESFLTIHEVVDPTAPLDSATCPDDVFASVRAPDDTLFRLELWSIDYCGLPGVEGCDAWEWLEHTYTDDLQRIAADPQAEHSEYTLENVGKPEHRFLAVFVASERLLPSNFEKGGLFKDPAFDGGWWNGGVVLVDLEQRAELCRVPFTAENSDSVEVDDEGAFRDDPEKEVVKDFEKNMERACNDAIEARSEQVKVNFYGIF